MTTIIRLQNTLDAKKPRKQGDFSRNKEYQRQMTFIDKFLYSLYPKTVKKTLTKQGIDKPYIEALTNIYRRAKVKVKIYAYTPEFSTSKLIPQRNSISLKFFGNIRKCIIYL